MPEVVQFPVTHKLIRVTSGTFTHRAWDHATAQLGYPYVDRERVFKHALKEKIFAVWGKKYDVKTDTVEVLYTVAHQEEAS